MSEGLKPCPFCGGEAMWDTGGAHCASIDCRGHVIKGFTAEEWNARPAPAVQVPEGFLSDVMTAAGLLAHGMRDKGLSKRLREDVSAMLAAAPSAPAVKESLTTAGAVPVGDGYRLVPTKEKLRELLVAGAQIKVGELYARANGLKAGEVLMLVEGSFDDDNGMFGTTEYAPAVWNDEVKEYDSIYHLFQNDLSGFMDCEVLPASPAATKEG